MPSTKPEAIRASGVRRSPSSRCSAPTICVAAPAAERQLPRIAAIATTMPMPRAVLPKPSATSSPADSSASGINSATAKAAATSTKNGCSRKTSTPPITIASAMARIPSGVITAPFCAGAGPLHQPLQSTPMRTEPHPVNMKLMSVQSGPRGWRVGQHVTRIERDGISGACCPQSRAACLSLVCWTRRPVSAWLP